MTKDRAGGWLSALGAAAAVALGGCANGIPEGTISYYLPKAETTLTVTQTLTCASGNSLLQVVTVNAATTYSSDVDRAAEKITPNHVSGRFADADISFSFTDDGRLSGINTATTGQGGAIVKDVLAVVKAAGVAVAAAGAADTKKACEVIAKLAGKGVKADGGKTDAKAGAAAKGAAAAKGDAEAASPSITLTYSRTFGYDTSTGVVKVKDIALSNAAAFDSEFGTDFASQTFYSELLPYIPLLGFDFDVLSSAKMAAPKWAGSNTDLVVKLNSLAAVNLQVRGLKGNLTASNREPIWRGDVLVPLTRTEDLTQVPIPKAAFFGTRKFSLSLANHGGITKIGYASTGTSDTADAFGAIGSVVAANAKSRTVTQQAAALQAQADLIFQQQRLANCTAKPESCSGK